MKICFRALGPLTLIAALLFLFTEAGFSQEKHLSFTNEDIEKYRRPSDNKLHEQKRAAPPEKMIEDSKSRGKQEQEYWCKRASFAKRKVEKAVQDVREREEEITLEQSKTVRTSRKNATQQSRLRKAKDHLFAAERDLNDMENEAHRKGIPPGWLRCQFD